jgi:hypothetical protein
MRSSILDACTGTLIIIRAATATSRDMEHIFFMARSPMLLLLFFELFYSEDLMPFGVLVAVYHATAAGDTPLHDTSLSLLPQNLLDLTDLFLNFASYFFIGTFSFQAWIIA